MSSHAPVTTALTSGEEEALFGALVRHATDLRFGDHYRRNGRGHVYVAVDRIVRERERNAYAEAVQAFNGLHLMHGNTTGCWGGIGGAAMTSECALDCPNPKHEKAQEAWRDVCRKAEPVGA